jgi:hypothetical protein
MQYPPAEILKKYEEYVDETTRKLSLFSSVYVSPEMVQWLPKFFAREALVQVTNAEIQSVTLSEILGGKPDFLPSGKNSSPDGILDVVNEVYAPKGKNRSRWHDTEEFVKFAGTYGLSDVCFGIGDKSGLTLETPFGDSSALIRLRSEVEHPQLGSGLLVTVQIPFTVEEVSKEAAWLNFLEARLWTDFPQLGCWQLHHNELAHASFIPNALYCDGLATNFALWSVARARWLRRAHALLPDDLGIETNRAHALMFLERGEDAKALYFAHKGKPIGHDGELWERAIAEDFAEFRMAGLTHPMMAEIEKELGVSR